MRALRRPHSGPYDFEHRRGRLTAAAAVLALFAAGLVGCAIGNTGGTADTVRTVTVAAAAPTVYEHTTAGAVTAAEANLVQAETSCLGVERCQPPDAYSLAPDGGGLWSLAYRIKTYSPDHAVVEAWQLQIAAGGSAHSTLAWELADVPVSWTNGEWRESGQVTQAASGPTPPPDQTAGAASRSFAQTIAGFWRFPGAP
jgi:hypothetical protein